MKWRTCGAPEEPAWGGRQRALGDSGGQGKQDHCWGPFTAAHCVPKALPSWLVSPRTQLASLKSTQIKYRQRDSSQRSEEQG